MARISIAQIEKDLQIKVCNLIDFEKLREIIMNEKPDEIYNLAAQSHVAVSFDTPEYLSLIHI